MQIWALIRGLVALAALVLWGRWLCKPSPSAVWPRQVFIRVTFLYIVPFFLVMLSAAGIDAFSAGLGTLGDVMTYLVGIPMLLMFPEVVLAFLYPLGVPTPPFLVPRWIREQDRKHRELKRAARNRRWQDPKVKKSEIWFNISIPFIVIGIVAVLFFIFVGIASLLFWLVQG